MSLKHEKPEKRLPFAGSRMWPGVDPVLNPCRRQWCLVVAGSFLVEIGTTNPSIR